LLRKFFLIGVLLLAAACAGTPAEPTPAADSPPTIAATPTPESVAEAPPDAVQALDDSEPLAARVNGIGISQAVFQRALTRIQQQVAAADSAALEATVLDTLIEQELIEQAAAASSVIITPDQIEAEYQANRALAGSDAAWAQWLADNAYTEAEFRDSLQDALIASAMRDYITGDLGETALHVHARHILVDTEAAAQAVMQRLQNGEDFAALAASLSRDVTTRDDGGDLGWFVQSELLEPVLAQVAFALADGEIGGPIVTRLGYHIIQRLESGMRELPPEKRAMLAQIRFESWLQELSSNAVIERLLP
jgi:peptidyl-prolyl cis-trans isomerase C